MRPENHSRTLRKRIRRYALRTAAVLAVVTAALLCLGVTARAELKAELMALGTDLLSVEQPSGGGGTRNMWVNGARIDIDSGVVAGAVGEALDRAQTRCGTGEDGIFDATTREETPEQGFVACLDSGDNKFTVPDFVGLATTMADGGDVTEYGRVRYTYARQTKSGVHVVNAVILEGLSFNRMFPADADAPGTELPSMPRPPGSRRTLSAREMKSPYHFAMYSGADGTVADIANFYRSALPPLGWELLDPAAAAAAAGVAPPPSNPNESRLYVSRGNALVVLIIKQRSDGVSVAIAAGI